MPRSRTSSGGELLVELRRDDPTPLHRQLERELRSAIRSGRLEADTALPSSRALAGQLGLSRGVIVEAYEQLVAEGYLASRPGGATRVADNVGAGQVPARPARASLPGYQPPEDPPINFAAGRPDVSQFPRQAWMKSLRRVMNEAPSERLTYLDLRGAPELRIALASYLNRVRGTIADADAIVICNGFAQAQRLVVQVVRERAAAGGSPPRIRDSPRRRRRRATTGWRSRRSASTTRAWTSRCSPAPTPTPSSSRRPTSSRPARSCRRSGGRRSSPGRRIATR